MLKELFQWLAQDIHSFAVFNYLTLRAVLAAATSLMIGLFSGPYVIRKLTALKIGQSVRTSGPQSHLSKSGTPTMGGALILISIAVTTLLWADLANRFIWVVLLVTMAFGAIGWVDDYRKVVHRNPKGMSSREKYLWQSLVGAAASLYLAFAIAAPSTSQIWPLVQQWAGNGFVLDLPAREGLARAAHRRGTTTPPDRFEREEVSYHEGLRDAFLDIASSEADRCCVVDALAPKEEVAQAIWRLVEARFLAPAVQAQ